METVAVAADRLRRPHGQHGGPRAWSPSTARSATRSRATAAGSAPRTSSSAGASPSSARELRKKLFAGRPAVGETIRIDGMRFTVVGAMDRKMQMSNYFTSDDECAFIPYTTAGDLWDTRYASVLVFARSRRRWRRPRSSRCATRSASGSASRARTSGRSRCSGARSSGRSSTASRSACRCCSSSSARSPSASAGSASRTSCSSPWTSGCARSACAAPSARGSATSGCSSWPRRSC